MAQFKRFFAINGDIFLRTLCLIAVTTYFTAAGSAQGNMVLAANTLLMQFSSSFLHHGRICLRWRVYRRTLLWCTQFEKLQPAHTAAFAWGMALSAAFTLAYAVAGQCLLELLTNNAQVVAQAINFMPYACAIPIVSFAAFIYDGLFIGTTSTKLMLASMLAASMCFLPSSRCAPMAMCHCGAPFSAIWGAAA